MKKLLSSCLMICAILLGGLCTKSYAEMEPKAYLIVVSPGAGYETGAGVRLESTWRKDKFGVFGSGELLYQPKIWASSGYKYALAGQGRYYINDLYFGAGASWGGYDSEFSNSDVHWRKDAVWPLIQLGYDGDRWDLWGTYFFKETQTPNEVRAAKIGGSVDLEHNVSFIVETTYVAFDQSGTRRDDVLVTVGLGWAF